MKMVVEIYVETDDPKMLDNMVQDMLADYADRASEYGVTLIAQMYR